MLHLIGLALAIGFGIWFGLTAFVRGQERRADRLERRAVKARQRAVWEAEQQRQAQQLQDERLAIEAARRANPPVRNSALMVMGYLTAAVAALAALVVFHGPDASSRPQHVAGPPSGVSAPVD